jgi:hypothetical protein
MACAAFWRDVAVQVVAVLVGGGLFTIGWGLVTGRRDSLWRVYDRVSAMMDDIGVSFTELFNVQRMCREGRENLTQKKAQRERDFTKIYDELYARGQASYQAMTRVGGLIDAIFVFDRPAVSAVANAYVDRFRLAQAELLAIDPINPEDDRKSDHAKEVLRAALGAGEALRAELLYEIEFWRVIHYLLGHPLRRRRHALTKGD